MDEKVSGFRYCLGRFGIPHYDVDIYKSPESKYYVQIDYLRSESTFDDLKDVGVMWKCVREVVEEILLSLQVFNDRYESGFGGGSSICPEPPL